MKSARTSVYIVGSLAFRLMKLSYSSQLRMSTPNFEIDKIRTEKPGHGPRLGIAPEIGKSRTESERGIIANVAAKSAAYAVNPWK